MSISSTGPLRVEENVVLGEVALAIKPGTKADVQERAIDAALAEAFHVLSAELGLTLAAPPHRYAQQLDGKDAEGRIRFQVRGRIEGDCIVPARLRKVHARPHADERNKVRVAKKAKAEEGS